MHNTIAGAIAAFAVASILGSTPSRAQNAYITNLASGNVSVIDTATNTVIATIPLLFPGSLAVAPDGSKVYIGNGPGPGTGADKISVIDTASNTVTATIPVGAEPVAFGVFIQPAPRFAGTPGSSNCYGQSVAALTSQYRGLNAAATALGFSSITALQNAIVAFCGG